MRIDDYINNSRDYERFAGFERSDSPYEVYVQKQAGDWEDGDVFRSLEDAVHCAWDCECEGRTAKVINRNGETVYPARLGGI